jgi:hypothetical protein
MKLSELFRSKKRRKYPVKFDKRGKSARSRCFEMFEGKTPLSEIAKYLGIKIETVRRYHVQWKKDPDLEGRHAYLKQFFKKTAPDREKNIELVARACGIPKEQFETVLSQPHGLRRLLTGKLYFQAHVDYDHKLYLALQVAMAISEHLEKKGGKVEDVLLAFQRWMHENKIAREAKDADIVEENKTMTLTHRVLAAAAEQEKQGRVQLDRLTDQERDTILQYGIISRKRRIETGYWIKIAALMAQGLTREEAREKFYQQFIDQGDLKGAKEIREYQDRIHPLKVNDQRPSPPPPEPPATP